MIMHVAQSGIFALGTGSHSYLEFDLHAHGDPLTLVQVMANLGEPRMTTGGVNLVVGFRPSLWTRVAPEEMPAGVTDFERDVRGVDGYTMPATQHDLWVWWQATPIIRSSMLHAKPLLPWPRWRALLLKSPGGPTRKAGTSPASSTAPRI